MTGRGSVLEQLRADVSLTGAGQDGDDRLAARFRSRGNFQGGPNGGTRRDPAKNTSGFGQESGGSEGALVCHLHDIVKQRPVQHFRYEAGSDTLDLVGTFLPAGEHR